MLKLWRLFPPPPDCRLCEQLRGPLALLAVVLLAGCVSGDYERRWHRAEDVPDVPGLRTYPDTSRGVVCYMLDNRYASMSCVKVR